MKEGKKGGRKKRKEVTHLTAAGKSQLWLDPTLSSSDKHPHPHAPCTPKTFLVLSSELNWKRLLWLIHYH